ncbi:MAG: HlyD family efflux transporter periplasmic adaptor subunit [Alphaproteobacteria bacterium]
MSSPSINAPNLQVVHESETQRQHVRLAVPGRALVNGKECALRNLSAGGVAIEVASGDFKPGTPLRLDLSLPFDGFSLMTKLEGEVRHFSPASKLLGCRFVNPTSRQISFLTHVLRSFISGEVVTAGNVLNVAARNNFAKARAPVNRENVPGFARQIPGLLLVAALGVLLIMFIGSNLYNSIFVVRSRDAVVAGAATPLRAPVAGTVHMRLDPGLAIVKRGQALGTITPVNGASVTITSPCNCYITKTNLGEGDIAEQGDSVLTLAPLDASPWVLAQVEPNAGMKIKSSSTATVSVFGSSVKYTGRVATIESPLVTGADGATVKVLLDQKLPIDFINRPAAVDFSTR